MYPDTKYIGNLVEQGIFKSDEKKLFLYLKSFLL